MVPRWIIALLLSAGMIAVSSADEPAPRASGKVSADQAGAKRFIESHCLDCHDKADQDGGPGARRADRRGHRPESGGLGKGCPQAHGAADAAEGCAAAGGARLRRGRRVAGIVARRGRRQASESRAHRNVPAAQPHGVPERDPRPAGAGGRRRRRCLPPDESSHGFDNITVADLSPTLLNRYVSAAQKISRLAVGRAPRTPRGRHVPHSSRCHAGRARRGPAARHARRHVDSRTTFRRTASTRFRSA